MTLIQVDSTNVKRIGYEENTLYIEYDNGLYAYKDVSKVLYEALLEAPSKGKFINSRIKNKYECRKIVNAQ